MIIGVDSFLDNDIPLIDVRSPSEYIQGHIPGAVSLPLFTDDERCQVGTTYKQIGAKEAFQMGLDFVGPKMSYFVSKGEKLSCNNKVNIYCWRGGKRSQSIGWLLQQAGLHVNVLQGGYKSYRQQAMQQLSEPAKIIVIGGGTGSGKTEILKQLQHLGEQVLDLEGLANHRGSAFGGIGQQNQPSNEQFFNKIWEKWRSFDHTQTIWIENESLCIGRVTVPEPLLAQMKEAPLLVLSAPLKMRVQYLIDLYGGQPKDKVELAIHKIRKKLGLRDTKQMLSDLNKGDLVAVVNRLLKYYDKSYQHCLSRTDPTRIQSVIPSQSVFAWDGWVKHMATSLMEFHYKSG
ncbi:MAG: tRNA 2-selenouridine(34) synthase MnmH [Magnetococcales bacterium]|nr:tRNA 2-selenouridine(34) synthase MnmH [Magnetococcales bacterium]